MSVLARNAQGLVDRVASRDPRRRTRLMQWLVAVVVYAGAALIMQRGIGQGWLHGAAFAAWVTFVASCLAACYAAVRSGWSERYSDPALTQVQIVMGIIAVVWGYLICGPVRTITLFPLLLIFAFGAFSLHWRRIVSLTVFAIAALGAAMLVLEAGLVARETRPLDPLVVDRINFLMVLIVLPALSVIAARLSSMRSALRAQKRALSRALEEVHRLATCDELTGLPNRRSMLDRLAHAQAVAARGGVGFCVAVIDLDDFKQVNDALGHAKGDELLRAFAREAGALLRGTDRLGRWGGEEFLLVLDASGPADAQRVLERLQQQAATIRAGAGPLRFSAGIAEHRPGEDVCETIARADQAMYAAKRGGRDAVRLEAPANAAAGA